MPCPFGGSRPPAIPSTVGRTWRGLIARTALHPSALHHVRLSSLPFNYSPASMSRPSNRPRFARAAPGGWVTRSCPIRPSGQRRRTRHHISSDRNRTATREHRSSTAPIQLVGVMHAPRAGMVREANGPPPPAGPCCVPCSGPAGPRQDRVQRSAGRRTPARDAIAASPRRRRRPAVPSPSRDLISSSRRRPCLPLCTDQ
jgi:hypothetical protein